METAETFLPIFWVAFAPFVVLVVVIAAKWIGDQITGGPNDADVAAVLVSNL